MAILRSLASSCSPYASLSTGPIGDYLRSSLVWSAPIISSLFSLSLVGENAKWRRLELISNSRGKHVTVDDKAAPKARDLTSMSGYFLHHISAHANLLIGAWTYLFGISVLCGTAALERTPNR
ncbi:hypothetical protein PDE_03900 [Penicillium oxalicum 114-2]|uniref:Uncharacterized protein n=1 Tax=Penicillium oxalicum (strain 114-2 / CGMCC 5302) TaxID=933388 RepID=S7ZF95_PENO1|nr:hypothetical protein PDE_03900 [Penicillium oxalicum 114-2]